ncbi:MAG: bifunctional oligoribonuclease/PAP phosphatase NrnA [Spirochaetales bacterium]|nr:bifunctional oligoribonuclease/PAP phosphatase NrnA [Spirochaetales bacterium]
MTVTQKESDAFSEFLNEYDFFYVSGHKEPDGDSIASCLGIVEILKHKNKPYQLISCGPFKRSEIMVFEKYFSSEIDTTKLNNPKTALIQVDCSEIERVGADFSDLLKSLPVFIIDHHKTASADPEKSIVYPDSPAASYLVQQLYENLVGKPDEQLAKNLFFGLCTDTGFFRFLNSESQQVFEAAGRLVKQGANPRLTYSEINSGKSFSTRKLLGLMLEKAEQYYDGKLIVTYETLEDTQKLGKNGRDSDSLYNLLLSVEGCEAVLFIRQDTSTTCTAGFRSKDDIDVSKIASKFGGGGHKNASGLSTQGILEELMPKIVKEFGSIFN